MTFKEQLQDYQVKILCDRVNQIFSSIDRERKTRRAITGYLVLAAVVVSVVTLTGCQKKMETVKVERPQKVECVVIN